MAAPAVASKGTAASGTGTTVSPTRPASIAADDIEILFANSYTGGGTNNTTFTDPSGWTRLVALAYWNQFFSNNGMIGLWWRRAAGGESGTVSLVRGGVTTEVFHAQLYRVTGCITYGPPFDSVEGFNGTAGAAITYVDVVAQYAERTLFAIGASVANAALGTPASYTSLGFDGSATGSTSTLHGFHRANVGAGIYSASSATGGGTNGSGSVHMSFIPPELPPVLRTNAISMRSVFSYV